MYLVGLVLQFPHKLGIHIVIRVKIPGTHEYYYETIFVDRIEMPEGARNLRYKPEGKVTWFLGEGDRGGQMFDVNRSGKPPIHVTPWESTHC